MISSDEPLVEGNDNQNQRQSLEHQRHLKKTSASPSNGQCPTAVSTIHSFAGSNELQSQLKQRKRPRNSKMLVEKSQTGGNHDEEQNVALMGQEIKQEVVMAAELKNKSGTGTAKNSAEKKRRSDQMFKTTFEETVEQQQQEDTQSFYEPKIQKKEEKGGSEQVSDQAKQVPKEKKFRVKNSENSQRDRQNLNFETQKRPSFLIMKRGDDNLREQDQGTETAGYNFNMQNNAGGVSGSQNLKMKKVNGQTIAMISPSSNQLQINNAVIEFNNSQSPQDPDQRMTSSRSKNNQSPSQEESVGMPIQITNQSKRLSSLNPPDQTGNTTPDEDQQYSMKAGGSTPSAQEYQKLKQIQQTQQQETLQSYQGQIGSSSNRGQYQRDESPPFGGGSRDGSINTNNQSMRNQQQRLSQPDRINTQASHHQAAGPGTSANAYNQTQSKRSSPKQNARSFIIRNTTQQNNYSVPTQHTVHQPKVLPPVSRAQIVSKKGKTPIINGQANQSFQLNSRVTGAAAVSKKASPSDGNRDGQIRRLSQNQNSINTYLEQESKFDSTKDASDLGGFGGQTSSLVKDYNSSLPDSIKVKGSTGQHDQRSYDEAWQVDQGSQNSYQHGEVSCEPQPRLVSAQTSLLNKRRPSGNGNRLNQEFFEGSVENDQPIPGNSKKQMQQLSQPRPKDLARNAQHIRGTLQSQNQNRFVDEMIDDDDEYYASAQIAMHHDGTKIQNPGQNNYNSPVQLREMGLSQQMVPNQMKQQLKQRRTVYGQSFFNSPPYPTGSQHFGMQHQPDNDVSAVEKTRNAQLDSSLRRKRQLPVPTSNNLIQQQQVVVGQSKPKKHQHHRLMSGSNVIQQPQLPQSQQRKTLQRHIESTTQHLEFDERANNEGKISQLSRFNVYQAGMRNVLTAGEDKRVVEHFPVSRASRWKQQNQGQQPPQQVNGNVYDHMMHMEGYDGGAGQDHMPGVGRQYQAQMMQIQNPPQEHNNERRVSGGAKQRGGGSRGLGQQQNTQFAAAQQQFQQNTKKLPKRSGTASYITQGGVRITINKDNKHLNEAKLTTETEENMNLMFYDFNNTKAQEQEVIPEENQRNLLRSQTTDRNPSRQIRSRGRFKLASSNQQKRGEGETGLGEVRPPPGVSTEFEMGMYPPDSSHQVGDDPTEDSRHIMQHEAAYGKPDTMHSSPHKKDFNADGALATYSKNNSKVAGNRNIQGKRLSSQTIQRQSQKPGQGIQGNTMISSHHPYLQEQSTSPAHGSNQGGNALAQSAGQRRIQKQYRAADGTSAAGHQNQGVVINSSKANHNRASMPGPNSGKMKGHPYNQPRNELFRSSNNPKSHHAGEPLQNMQNQHQHSHQQNSQSSQKGQHHNPQSRLPQHRQTNLANVMESIREEDPHL